MSDELQLNDADRRSFREERALGMVAPDAPQLSEVAAAVPPEDVKSAEVQEVVQAMFAAAGGQITASNNATLKGTVRRLVGLAAPQVGAAKRIILVDTKVRAERRGASRLECFINPEIVWRSRETLEGREGCFSAGPVWGLVRRAAAVKIRALTPEGKSVERIFEGFTARIVQHEIDHLDGVRFPERIRSDRKRHWVHVDERAEYVQNPKAWPRHVTRAEWEAFKRGRLPKGAQSA